MVGQNFFDMPIWNDEETCKQIIGMGRNNDYTTGNLLDYEYISKYYKLITIDLNKQTELENPDLKQQINFIGRLERNERAKMFFIIEKSEETTFEFKQVQLHWTPDTKKWKLQTKIFLIVPLL